MQRTRPWAISQICSVIANATSWAPRLIWCWSRGCLPSWVQPTAGTGDKADFRCLCAFWIWAPSQVPKDIHRGSGLPVTCFKRPRAVLALLGPFQGWDVRDHIVPQLSCRMVASLWKRWAQCSGIWLNGRGSGFCSISGQQSLFAVYCLSFALFPSLEILC